MVDTLRGRIVPSLEEIDSAAWNALGGCDYPFLRHEFLCALERQGCLGKRSGWYPAHLIFERSAELVAALPMYKKSNSFGEFVFDWSWAEAYQRNGLPYYPKLVVAAPFTPATGPRILLHEAYRDSQIRPQLIQSAIDCARDAGVSGLHILFSNHSQDLDHPELMQRMGCQFHWHNHCYRDFSDFCDTLSAKKRKLIKRERRRVQEAGIELEQIPGNRVSEQQWFEFYAHYQSTFELYGNFPALTSAFFLEIARRMGEQIMLVIARRDQKIIASSYFLVGSSVLYGRYWGCSEEIPGLHFEACYYQGIEYCIEKGLLGFEPGAQGEHKISRGFLPTRTWSGHWIKDPRFQAAISDFLREESLHIERYIGELNQHSPYREDFLTKRPRNFPDQDSNPGQSEPLRPSSSPEKSKF